ncbi:MAG TPA: hypothetical protein VIL74_17840 [Pyrinomonadaceae bacterium]|jgi:hypothetical protein
MAQAKKRLSKAAKAAQKILEGSKLLAANKTGNEPKTDQNFKPNESPVKPTGANKMRPDKKRG